MNKKIVIPVFILFCLFTENIIAQRQYAANSVLVSGNWYKIAVVKEGVYKIDANFLSQTAIAAFPISSSFIKLYGNGGKMIPEDNAEKRPDDLIENAIEMYDGGDGIFNDNDYFLFYAPGPDSWSYNDADKTFQHQKNLVNDTCYYFLTIQPNGKRVTQQNNSIVPNTTVVDYDERIFYEKEEINMLGSGKNWYGESFNNSQRSQTYNYNLKDVQSNTPLKIRISFLIRSIGTSSSFDLSVNDQFIQNIPIKTVSGNLIDNYAEQVTTTNTITSPGATIKLNYTFNPASVSSQGWLDWFELQCRRVLKFGNNNQMSFRDCSSVGINNIAQFVVGGADSNTEVWEVNEFSAPVKMKGDFTNNELKFTNEANELHEYIAFDRTKCPMPIPVGKVNNQNLHQSVFADYLIITPELFLTQAEKLAQFHTVKNNLSVKVAQTEEIYNEFGGGNKSAAAIRDYIKMYFDKAGLDINLRPKYVLLFGIGNYDTKGRTASAINHIPCFESDNSINPVLSYTSDDFYALLSDDDDLNNTNTPDDLKVSVGRLPVTTIEEANTAVDKIINYNSNETLGSWRNDLLFLADDKDANLFLNTSEQITKDLEDKHKQYNYNKLYVDAYPVVNQFYNISSPKVNQSVIDQLYSGKLIFNYSGHGNYQQLSSYSILGLADAKKLNNATSLPLFITSTCDFIPYDDPTKNSLGSYMFHGSKNGAIALVTTPRLAFAGSNQIVNENFLKYILQTDADGKHLSLGEAFRLSKNFTNQTSADVINNRKFSLIGDPATELSFPKYRISVDSVNNKKIENGDNLQAGKYYTLSGFIRNNNGDIITDFNGTVYPRIYDKPRKTTTLGNDPTSIVTDFYQQDNLIYSGKATVVNGVFNFGFFVSKNVSDEKGKVKISLYAENGREDASGFDTSLYVTNDQVISNTDNVGPGIKLYLNDYSFRNAGKVADRALLLVRLADSSGINTIDYGNIDRNIRAVIDGDESHPIILNTFYLTDLDTYKRGGIAYQLPPLVEGPHTIKLTAWDNNNNINSSTLSFSILESGKFQIHNLINYPNPVAGRTNISFQINEPSNSLKATIDIFTIDGRAVFRMNKHLNTTATFIDIPIDTEVQKLSPGLYFYKVTVVNSKGEEAKASQKMLKY